MDLLPQSFFMAAFLIISERFAYSVLYMLRDVINSFSESWV